ncbi:MAG: SDR family oxidoreductase, partial [Opitutae bacterium]|nr:SDR family oxidoreductase [Opitutae bacterium]
TRNQLNSLVEECGSDKVIPFEVDVSKKEQVEEAIAAIQRDYGVPDVLINNAGVVENISFAEQSIEMIERIVDVNLKGALYVTRCVVPGMIARGSGRIINVSSVAGTRGIPGQATYCASKFGMNGFAETLAQELLAKGILVTTICPGGIDTPLWDPDKNPYPGDKARIMKPQEIVDLIEYLLDQPKGTLHKKIVMFPTNEWH